MESTNNLYQKAIEALIADGHTILQIFNMDGSCFYFSVLDFQESFTSPTNSVEFNSLRGINITDFMRTQGGNINILNIKSRFQEYILNAEVIRLEFCKNLNWMKWGSASR